MRNTGQLFCKLSFNWNLSDVFLRIRVGLWVLRRVATEERCYFNYIMLLLLLLLSRFSRVWLCATPQMAAHQPPPSLGFSRQEHWSGLPFPSPMHESEKWKWSRSVVTDSERPHGLQPTRLFHPWDFPGKSTGVGCHCLLRTISWEESIINLAYYYWCWLLSFG